MKRALLVTIDAGDTTCDGCARLIVSQYSNDGSARCQYWWKPMGRTDTAIGNFKRLPECLEAERRANEQQDVCTLHAIRTGNVT